MSVTGRNLNHEVVRSGVPLHLAKGVIIMVHGRGSTADNIIELAREFSTEGFAFIAPQAHGFSWYPNSFLAPIESNEPGISSGLQSIADIIAEAEQAGVQSGRIILLGFSQGACLSLEFAARNARLYGGVIGLSGGLIGPSGTTRNYAGSFRGTPVFLGCDESDAHIPAARVRETADVLKALGANVTMRLYHGMGHTVNRDEIRAIDAMMMKIVNAPELTKGK